jgi:hypothetical protein
MTIITAMMYSIKLNMCLLTVLLAIMVLSVFHHLKNPIYHTPARPTLAHPTSTRPTLIYPAPTHDTPTRPTLIRHTR